MSTPAEKADLQRRLEYFKRWKRLQGHGLTWLLCRWAWVGIRLLWAGIRAAGIVCRQERFDAHRKRERDTARLDRLRNPDRYRGQD